MDLSFRPSSPSCFSVINAFTIILLLTATNGFSQNTIKDTVSIKYLKPPASPLPHTIYTYSVHLSFDHDENQQPFHQNQDLLAHGNYRLNGYEQDKDGDLKIEIVVGSYENKVGEERLIDGRFSIEPGLSNVTKLGYKYEIDHRLPVYFKVTTQDNETIIPSVWANNSNRFSTFRTDKTFNSKKALEEYWRHQAEADSKKAANKLLDHHINSIFTILNHHFGFSYHHKLLEVYSAQATTKYSYSDLARAAGLALTAYRFYSTEKFNESASALIQAQDIWINALEEFYSAGKECRINKQVAMSLHYNLMMSCLWLENFDAAIAHIKKAEALEKDNDWSTYWSVFLIKRSALHKRSF